MIRYRLICDQKHEFDGWFPSSEAFDSQAAKGLLACALCNSPKVEKALMAPSVTGTKKSKSAGPRPDATAAGPLPGAMAASLPPHVLAMMQQLRDYVRQNSENVGDRFAEEARKIHYEETDPRSIHGQATRDEARLLLEEGIEVHPLPVLPEDRN